MHALRHQGSARGDAQTQAIDAGGGPDRGRLAAIYSTYCPYVWRCVRRMGVAPEQVEDVVQDVFLVVSERLTEFEGRAALKTWIYAITFRVAAEHRRRRHREARPKPLAWDPSAPSSADEELHARQLAGRLHELLETLDLEQRAVFVLVELEQLSGPEIAQILGIKLNTVYSRLRLARRRIERELAVRGGNVQGPTWVG
ncbi:MAG TPA: sigma-70 family RNA polymerase sigma factor [Nannocystaceae bacterium]|nr:sigma-70 family RNA polymerase sigma factor [Nannocystaceae bacterium]